MKVRIGLDQVDMFYIKGADDKSKEHAIIEMEKADLEKYESLLEEVDKWRQHIRFKCENSSKK